MPVLTRNDRNARFRKKTLPMAVRRVPAPCDPVINAQGEAIVDLARMDTPVYFVRNAALRARTLPNHERTAVGTPESDPQVPDTRTLHSDQQVDSSGSAHHHLPLIFVPATHRRAVLAQLRTQG